jgi:hypothetical protein
MAASKRAWIRRQVYQEFFQHLFAVLQRFFGAQPIPK